MRYVRALLAVVGIIFSATGLSDTFSEGVLKQVSDELKAKIGRASEPMIYHGRPVRINSSPWQVVVLRNGAADIMAAVVCGGVLIDSVWVLTAAHCFFDPKTKRKILDSKFSVGYGSDNLTKFVNRVKIKRVIVNESYDSSEKEFDVALVRLEIPVSVDGFIGLPGQEEAAQLIKPNTLLMISGWGMTETGVKSNLLLETEVPVIDFRDCIKHYNSRLPANAICAGGRGKDACTWDSGGPLFKRSGDGRAVQIGIVSYGNACGSEAPGVYTPVAAHLDWIAKARNEN